MLGNTVTYQNGTFVSENGFYQTNEVTKTQRPPINDILPDLGYGDDEGGDDGGTDFPTLPPEVLGPELTLEKTCPNCRTVVEDYVTECPNCGHLWPAFEESDPAL